MLCGFDEDPADVLGAVVYDPAVDRAARGPSDAWRNLVTTLAIIAVSRLITGCNSNSSV